VSPGGVALFAFGSAIATIAVTPFVPGVLARFGARRALAYSLCIVACVFLLYRALPSYEMWFGLRALASLAFCILFVACEGWALERAAPERRGFVMGLFASVFAGAMALGGGMVTLFGHRALET
jgi:MFS family permease